jgi:hypothetical protein
MTESSQRIAALEGDVSGLMEQLQSLQGVLVSKTKLIKDYREQITKLEASLKDVQVLILPSLHFINGALIWT